MLASLLIGGATALAVDNVAPISLVSESAAVCLEVPHPAATWAEFRSSQLAARLQRFPPVERFLGGAGFQKWMHIEEHVRRLTKKSLSDHLLTAASESLVVAVYLPDGKPPEGLVIAQARDAESLTQSLQAWSTLEPQQVLMSLEYRGHKYVKRTKANSPEVLYYTTLGRTLALSDKEHLIQQAIDLANRNADSSAAATGLLQDLPLYKTNKSKLPASAAAQLFVNVGQWHKVIDQATRSSSDAKWVLPVVQQVPAISVSLELNEEAVIKIIAGLGDFSQSDAWKRFVAQTNVGEQDWTARLPSNAVAAISSRMDLRTLVQLWLLTAPEVRTDEFAKGRNALRSLLLGRDLFDEVLPRVLHDWTVAVVAPDDVTLGPPNLTARFSLHDSFETGNSSPPFDQSVDHALEFGLSSLAAMLSHQRGATTKTPVVVESHTTAASVVRSLNGIKIWTPAYEVSSTELIGASSRETLGVWQSTEKRPVNARLASLQRRHFHKTSQLIWLDARRLEALLKLRGDWIAGHLAPGSSDERQRIQKHLEGLSEALSLFDAAFAGLEFGDDHIRIVAGAALDQSR
jgi:hypothetical protein